MDNSTENTELLAFNSTEAYLNRIDYISQGDPVIKKRLLDRYKAQLKIGFNPASKSLESIRVMDKKFDKPIYKSFEDLEQSDAGCFAMSSLANSFNDTLRPVSNRDFDRYKDIFTNKVFKKAIVEFKTKFLNPNVASTCSYTVDKDRYSTVVLKARFLDKEGKKTNYGALYALEWYKGKPICKPIIPIVEFGTSKKKEN